MFDCQRVTVCWLRFGRNQWVQDLSDWKCNLDPGTLEATCGFHFRSFASYFYTLRRHTWLAGKTSNEWWFTAQKNSLWGLSSHVTGSYPERPKNNPGHPGHLAMNCERKSRRDFDDLDLSFKFIPLACFAGANVLLTTLFLGEKARHGGFILRIYLENLIKPWKKKRNTSFFQVGKLIFWLGSNLEKLIELVEWCGWRYPLQLHPT